MWLSIPNVKAEWEKPAERGTSRMVRVEWREESVTIKM
jgi:hypothetical protein